MEHPDRTPPLSLVEGHSDCHHRLRQALQRGEDPNSAIALAKVQAQRWYEAMI